jgi:hypothetical protein
VLPEEAAQGLAEAAQQQLETAQQQGLPQGDCGSCYVYSPLALGRFQRM